MTNTTTPSPAASATGRSFNELPLSPGTLATLQQLGYLTMTPIQAASSLSGFHDKKIVKKPVNRSCDDV